LRGLTRDSQTTLATKPRTFWNPRDFRYLGNGNCTRVLMPSKQNMNVLRRVHGLNVCKRSQTIATIVRNGSSTRADEHQVQPTRDRKPYFRGRPKKLHMQPWAKAWSPQLGSDLLADFLQPTSASTSPASRQQCSASSSAAECSAERCRESVVGGRLRVISHERWPHPPTKNRYGQSVTCYSERE
jgi:hypothetical protein